MWGYRYVCVEYGDEPERFGAVSESASVVEGSPGYESSSTTCGAVRESAGARAMRGWHRKKWFTGIFTYITMPKLGVRVIWIPRALIFYKYHSAFGLDCTSILTYTHNMLAGIVKLESGYKSILEEIESNINVF